MQPFNSGFHPGFAQPISATAPQTNGTSRPAEILQMEDNLRRMLKLNSGPAPAAPQPTNYQSS
jgi:hypothetical protein